MKLVTFQTKNALAVLQKTGILQADVDHINLKKYAVPYGYIVAYMKKKIPPARNEKYPLWVWVKCGSSSAPRKVKNYAGKKQDLVKITFEKPDKEVLLSDYMAYSFILSGHIVPKTKKEYEKFLKMIEKGGISVADLKGVVRQEKVSRKVKELFPKIEKTWNRIFVLRSNVYQGCVWNIKMSEVKKIEVINDPNHIYGTMNAKQLDGTRPDWKKQYLKFLSDKNNS